MDLPGQTLTLDDGESIPFDVDPFRKHCLLEGLDDIGLTLQHVDAIRAYEERRRRQAPWLFAVDQACGSGRGWRCIGPQVSTNDFR